MNCLEFIIFTNNIFIKKMQLCLFTRYSLFLETKISEKYKLINNVWDLIKDTHNLILGQGV